MGLLKFLAVVFLVILAIRLIGRLILPLLGKYAINKVTETMRERQESQSNGNKIYQDGDVTIRRKDEGKNTSSSRDEEYVDFQEID
ncbi:MAG: hypothetical protein KC456_07345 [Flavobacteriales bacterium]|jgi:hypothetical protein|nr:hypothetical protein [Flavobacteriales bacterium]